MIIGLTVGKYTQINTDTDAYLWQNLSDYNLGIIISDTQPADTDVPVHIVQHLCGMTNSHYEGICWGKPITKVSGQVGLTEG